MAEFLTTKEVALYLRLNEKKVYALVAEGQLPAARISGKWLFPKHVIDEWVEKNTRYPVTGLMGALLDDLVVVQGSDDWLFSRVADRFQATSSIPVVSSRVGSLSGLEAVGRGKAHLAGCHVSTDQVRKLAAKGEQGCYLITLFSRDQGLIFDRNQHPGVTDLPSIVEQDLSFARRQSSSGTSRLVDTLLARCGAKIPENRVRGPYETHLALAMAVRNGEAECGVGTHMAAEQCGLDFVLLHTEDYKLVVPVAYASHPRIVRLLEFILAELKRMADKAVTGYGFEHLGRMETVGLGQ